MKTGRLYRFMFLFLVLMVLGYFGCARTQPSRFYALTAISDINTTIPENLSADGKTIGVGPVEIPSQLNRPQIVTLRGPHQIHMAEFDRWAGTLKENINLVIVENLSALLPEDQVYVFPWRSVKPVQYQIVIRIMRFDTVPDETVTLDARWIISEREGRQMLLEKGSQIRIPFTGNGYEDIVSAQSQALGELSREIAATVQTLPENGQP
jgi:uncharacterized protein